MAGKCLKVYRKFSRDFCMSFYEPFEELYQCLDENDSQNETTFASNSTTGETPLVVRKLVLDLIDTSPSFPFNLYQKQTDEKTIARNLMDDFLGATDPFEELFQSVCKAEENTNYVESECTEPKNLAPATNVPSKRERKRSSNWWVTAT